MVMLSNELWAEWGRITKFLECSKIAFSRELEIWKNLEIAEPKSIKIKTQNGKSDFQLSLDEHLATLVDEAFLYTLVLTLSYALCERHARLKLNIKDGNNLPGGIESWGEALLLQNNQSWESVHGGKGGLIEVAIARNLFSHGSRTISQSTIERYRNAKEICPWKIGDSVKISYEIVEEYRSRIKSYMRVCKF